MEDQEYSIPFSSRSNRKAEEINPIVVNKALFDATDSFFPPALGIGTPVHKELNDVNNTVLFF